jgi:transposase
MSTDEGTVRLTLQERKELQKVTRSTDQPARAGVRATVLLMSAEGSSARTIARVLGIGLRTVRETRRRWRREGYEGLYDASRCGRPARADKNYRKLLRQVVQTDPRTLGYSFAHWTAPRLAEYLRGQTGVSLCDDWVRMILGSMGFVWRKTKLTIRNLQDRRKKKESSGASLEATECRPTARSGFRALVRGRSPLRPVADYYIRISPSRKAVPDPDAWKESSGWRLRSLPLS